MIKSLALPVLLVGLLVADVSIVQGKEKPKAAAAKAAAAVTLTISKKADGPTTMDFGAGDAAIFATYSGDKLAKGDKIRVVWIIEDGGKTVTPNAKVSEYHSDVEHPGDKGFSQLTRPPAGWPLGKWRVDVYVNDAKAGSAKFTIK